MQRGEFDSAAEELSDAAALNPRDMWIRYYLCVLKYRVSQAKHADIQGLPNMMQDLRAVLEWYPEFAEADDLLLAIARTEGGGPAAAMQAERAAIQLSPRSQQYVLHLAEIYVTDKKWDAARAILDRLKAKQRPQDCGGGSLSGWDRSGTSRNTAFLPPERRVRQLQRKNFRARVLRSTYWRRMPPSAPRRSRRNPRAPGTNVPQNSCKDDW